MPRIELTNWSSNVEIVKNYHNRKLAGDYKHWTDTIIYFPDIKLVFEYFELPVKFRHELIIELEKLRVRSEIRCCFNTRWDYKTMSTWICVASGQTGHLNTKSNGIQI